MFKKKKKTTHKPNNNLLQMQVFFVCRKRCLFLTDKTSVSLVVFFFNHFLR